MLKEPNRPDLQWQEILKMPQMDVYSLYEYAKKNYDEAKSNGIPSVIYLSALQLLSCGNLECIDDILENLPPHRHPTEFLVSAIDCLLPVPEVSKVRHNSEKFRAWFKENRSNLKWSSNAGAFVFNEATEQKK